MEAIKDITEIKKNDPIMVLRWLNTEEKSYTRQVFRVKAIDPPYIAVAGGYKNFPMRLVLDFREVEFGRPSEDFVKATMPQFMGPDNPTPDQNTGGE